MRIACWIPKATNTHSEYVTLIAFQLQRWLHERASMFSRTPRLFEKYNGIYVTLLWWKCEQADINKCKITNWKEKYKTELTGRSP